MNSRASVARQGAAALENPQTAIMNKLALYVFPLGILVSGAFFPVAILLYWVSNNLWTYGQQHIVFNRIEKEDEAKKAAKQEKLKANAPKPGARPERAKKKAGTDVAANGSTNGSSVNGSSTNGSTPNLTKGSSPAADESSTVSAKSNGSGAQNKAKQTATKQPAAKTPRPGQKPSGAGGRTGAAGSNTARRKKRR